MQATPALIETVKLAEAASEGELVGLLYQHPNIGERSYTVSLGGGVALAGAYPDY